MLFNENNCLLYVYLLFVIGCLCLMVSLLQSQVGYDGLLLAVLQGRLIWCGLNLFGVCVFVVLAGCPGLGWAELLRVSGLQKV